MPDLTATIAELLPALRADDAASLTWWTEAELYAFAAASIETASRKTAWFPRALAIVVTAGTPGSFALAARTVQVLLAIAPIEDGSVTTMVALQPLTAEQADAQRPGWQDEADTSQPLRFYVADAAAGTVLIPRPTISGNGMVISLETPAPVVSGSATVDGPQAWRDMIWFAVLARAYAKQSEARLADVSGWCQQIVDLMEGAAAVYYGN